MKNKEELKKKFVEALMKKLGITWKEAKEYEEEISLWEDVQEEGCGLKYYQIFELLSDLSVYLPRIIKDRYIFFKKGHLVIHRDLIDALIRVCCEDFEDYPNFPPWND